MTRTTDEDKGNRKSNSDDESESKEKINISAIPCKRIAC